MDRDLRRLSATQFDLAVIGGGIHGACAAWDAALRGWSVALIDQGDFGHATSANSQKIIHGGLRYLQTLDLPRMRESIRERRMFLTVAPHLVSPLPFVMPTAGRGLRSRSAMAAAFLINDLLSWDRNLGIADQGQRIPGGRVLSRAECLQVAPELASERLTGGACWHDGQIYGSERLTLAFVQSAAAFGAAAANYVEATGLLLEGRRATGVRAQDRLTGERLEIRARAVLNTSGPWAGRIAGFLGEGQAGAPFPALVKAMSIVTRPLTHGVALGISSRGDGRSNGRLFMITPWRDHSIIGTFYAPHGAAPGPCRITEEELDGIVAQVNAAHPAARLRREDITSVRAGLLPADPRDPSAPLARYRLVDHARRDGIEGLVSVIGVKYTTARDVAEHAVDLVGRRLGMPARPSLSGRTPVYGGQIAQVNAFLADAVRRRPAGLSPEVIRHLVHSYGSAYPDVLRHIEADPQLGQCVAGSSEVIRAEVVHGVRAEMAVRLSDVLFRRTDLGAAEHPGEACLRECAALMAEELGWDASRVAREIDVVEAVFPHAGCVPCLSA